MEKFSIFDLFNKLQKKENGKNDLFNSIENLLFSQKPQGVNEQNNSNSLLSNNKNNNSPNGVDGNNSQKKYSRQAILRVLENHDKISKTIDENKFKR